MTSPAAPRSAPRAAGATGETGALTPRGRALLASGLVVLVLACIVLDLSLRTLVHGWLAEEYVRTELVVVDVGDRANEPVLFATVAATGEEIHTRRLPTEVWAYDSPRDATGTLLPTEELRGRRIPVWWSSRDGWLFSDLRLAFVSEYGPTLPSARLALGIAAGNLVLAALGAALVRRGLRSRRSV